MRVSDRAGRVFAENKAVIDIRDFMIVDHIDTKEIDVIRVSFESFMTAVGNKKLNNFHILGEESGKMLLVIRTIKVVNIVGIEHGIEVYFIDSIGNVSEDSFEICLISHSALQERSRQLASDFRFLFWV